MNTGVKLQGLERFMPRTDLSQPRISPRHLRPGSGAIVLLVLALASMIGCEEKKEEPKPQPPEVEVTDVVQQNVPIFEEWVAQLNGPNNAVITPKVQGYLLRQNYQDGFIVRKGQLLYEIDPRPFEASLAQAKAQVAVAEANLSQANDNVTRDRPLAAQNAIPQKQLDTDVSTQAAQVAQVAASKAEMEQAVLNLGWTKVYSPIDGIAGLTNAQVGDLVGTATKMTTVSQVNPIWAYFSISESDYLLNAAKISEVIRGKSAGSPLRIQYIQANGITFPEQGKIVLVNRQVTSGTGTIQMAAEFPNKDAVLRPGGFGRVRIQTGSSENALLVPQAAVIEVQSMYQVVVVSPDNKANFRPVKVGDRVGTNWIITEGLKPGEKVVVQGFMKVREGIPVTPKPYVVAAPAAGGN